MSALPPVEPGRGATVSSILGEIPVEQLTPNPIADFDTKRFRDVTFMNGKLQVPGVLMAVADPNANQGIHPEMVLPKVWEDRVSAMKSGEYFVFKTPMAGSPLPRVTAVWFVPTGMEDVDATAGDVDSFAEFLPLFSFSKGIVIDENTTEHQLQLDQSVLGKWDGFQVTVRITREMNADGSAVQYRFRFYSAGVSNPKVDAKKNYLRLEKNTGSWSLFKVPGGIVVYYELHSVPNMTEVAKIIPGGDNLPLEDVIKWVLEKASGPISKLTSDGLTHTVTYFTCRAEDEDWMRTQELCETSKKNHRTDLPDQGRAPLK